MRKTETFGSSAPVQIHRERSLEENKWVIYGA